MQKCQFSILHESIRSQELGTGYGNQLQGNMMQYKILKLCSDQIALSSTCIYWLQTSALTEFQLQKTRLPRTYGFMTVPQIFSVPTAFELQIFSVPKAFDHGNESHAIWFLLSSVLCWAMNIHSTGWLWGIIAQGAWWHRADFFLKFLSCFCTPIACHVGLQAFHAFLKS